MSDPAFTRGVADYRAGRPPNYDAFNFTQATKPASVTALINAHWNYERGRHWAAIAPDDLPLKIGGRLNPEAIRLFRGDDFV
jgi:hypothetical protein